VESRCGIFEHPETVRLELLVLLVLVLAEISLVPHSSCSRCLVALGVIRLGIELHTIGEVSRMTFPSSDDMCIFHSYED
jgi:hypothetical protein